MPKREVGGRVQWLELEWGVEWGKILVKDGESVGMEAIGKRWREKEERESEVLGRVTLFTFGEIIGRERFIKFACVILKNNIQKFTIIS